MYLFPRFTTQYLGTQNPDASAAKWRAEMTFSRTPWRVRVHGGPSPSTYSVKSLRHAAGAKTPSGSCFLVTAPKRWRGLVVDVELSRVDANGDALLLASLDDLHRRSISQ
eukprot:scaffold104491_cov60-Phaeocystis_antarctica.AAC.1